MEYHPVFAYKMAAFRSFPVPHNYQWFSVPCDVDQIIAVFTAFPFWRNSMMDSTIHLVEMLTVDFEQF
jgi:hypothetical protein